MRFQGQLPIWLINALLVGLAVFFGSRTYHVWTDKPDPSDPAVSSNRTSGMVALPALNEPLPPRSHYAAILEQNLFTQTRALQTKAPGANRQESDATPHRPVGLVLHGIVIENEEKKALISMAGNGSGGGQFWVREGDQIGRLFAKEILADRLVLSGANAAYTLRLSQDDSPRPRYPASRKQPAPGIRATVPQKQPDTKHIPTHKLRPRFIPAQ